MNEPTLDPTVAISTINGKTVAIQEGATTLAELSDDVADKGEAIGAAIAAFKQATPEPTIAEQELIKVLEESVSFFAASASNIAKVSSTIDNAACEIVVLAEGISLNVPAGNPLIVPAFGNAPFVHQGAPGGTAGTPGMDATGEGRGAAADLLRATI